MNEFYKQDIFFVITTVAVVILTILLSIFAYYAIKVIKDIKFISEKAKRESELLSQDIAELKDNIRASGAKLKPALSFLFNLYRKTNPKREKKNGKY